MANFLGKDPHEYDVEKRSFLSDVRRFHGSRGTGFRTLPRFAGCEVDLYLLYTKVTALGGWAKVNDKGKWKLLLPFFTIPPGCVNAAYALKNIYQRYLEHYERLNFLGLDIDRPVEEDEESAAQKKRKLQRLSTVPMVYKHHQHNVPEHVRVAQGLSTDLVTPSDYDKLEKSLLSGLPNEVDFTVNVCTLLSNEGKHVMKLEKSQRLLMFLMGQVGIFTEGPGSLLDLHEGFKKHTNRNFLKFWYDTVEETEYRDLISPYTAFKELVELMGEDYPDINPSSQPGSEFLNLEHNLGLDDVEGQRIIQVASIIRNLSFEECNLGILSKDLLVLRFILLCSHSKYSCLKQMGLDTLGNLALNMALDPIEFRTTQYILKTVCSCLASYDKFDNIRGMEILSNLCLVEKNEDIISDNLQPKAYENIVSRLTVMDIQLIVQALEVLYQLSELGEAATHEIASVYSCVDLLVTLVTIEAQSYGQKALVGIKVVEHAAPGSTSIVAPPSPVRAPAPTPPTPNHPPPPPAPTLISSQKQAVDLKMDPTSKSFLNTWLRAHYEASFDDTYCTRVDVYGNYLSACGQYNAITIVSTGEFTKVVKNTYQNSSCRRVVKATGPAEAQFVGMRKRPVPLPFPPAGETRFTKVQPPSSAPPQSSSPGPTRPSPSQSPSSSEPRSRPGSVLQKQLNTPPKNTPLNVLEPKNLQLSFPPQPNMPVQTAVYLSGPGAIKPDTNTIKTMLANKVNQNIQRLQGHTLSPQSSAPQSPLASSSVSMMPSPTQSTAVNQENRKRKTNESPNRIAAKVPKTIMPKPANGGQTLVTDPNCQLEVCGDVERAQDLVKGGGIVREAMIERIENTKSTSQSMATVQSQPVIMNTGQPVIVTSTAPNTVLITTMMPSNANVTVVNHGSIVMSRGLSSVTTTKTINGPIPILPKIVPSVVTSKPAIKGVNSINDPARELEDALGSITESTQELKSEISHSESDNMSEIPNAIEKSVVSSTVQTQPNGETESTDKSESENAVSSIVGIENDVSSIAETGSTTSSVLENDSMAIKKEAENAKINNEDGSTKGEEDMDISLDEEKPEVDIKLEIDTKPVIHSVGKEYKIENSVADVNSNDTKPKELSQKVAIDHFTKKLNGPGSMKAEIKSDVVVSNGIPMPLLKLSEGDTDSMSSMASKTSDSVDTDDLVSKIDDQKDLLAQVLDITGITPDKPPMNGVMNHMGNGDLKFMNRVVVENGFFNNEIKPKKKSKSKSKQTKTNGVSIRQCVVQNATLQGTTHQVVIVNSQPLTVTPVAILNMTRTNLPLQLPTQCINTVFSKPIESGGHIQLGSDKTNVNISADKKSKSSKKKSRSRGNSVDSRRSSTQSSVSAAEFVCEWNGCNMCFERSTDVFPHVFHHHFKPYEGTLCLWECCDKLHRKKYSLLTHLQDRHCNEPCMKAAQVRRQQVVTGPPQPPPPPPVYPPDAAIQAIKRFTAKPPYPEFLESKEGPVTKHIRLTSALILRNLARYSSTGRSLIKRHEQKLAYVTLSSVESSTALSNCLWELHQHH